MAKQPNVRTNIIDSLLSTNVSTPDGETILVVTMTSAYAALITKDKFTSLKDAEDAGVTESNDLTQNNLVWEHVKDFYTFPENEGTTLHLLKLEDTVTMTNIFTVSNNAYNALDLRLKTEGSIRLMMVAVNPTVTESHTSSLSSDLEAAIPLAHAFGILQRQKQRFIHIVLENRKIL